MTTDKNDSPVTAPMWWDGGDRAITAREKATIEEHGPSCYTIPLVPVQAVDPEDPWRGLYLPARMPAPSEYGDLFHPDIPSWPDDREDALDKLVHAQGFDFHIVAGDFTEAAMEDGDELYWQELRAWNPEAPEGEWRLAWKGDTEDGPYAWFVRPMALRPEPAALAATGKQQVGEVQGDAARYRSVFLDAVGMLTQISLRLGVEPNADGVKPLLAAIDALAARQPGAQADEAAILRHGAAVLDMWEGDPNVTGYMGDFKDACAILEVLALHAAPPAQGIDLVQQQDAARWRWVREQSGVTVSVEEADDDGDMAFVSGHTPEELDAAIDGQRDAAPGVANA